MLHSGRAQVIQDWGDRWVKNHWYNWRANQWSLVSDTLTFFFPPSNSLLDLGPLKHFLDTAPRSSRALNLTLCVASGTAEKQGHVRCGKQCKAVPEHRPEPLTQTLSVFTLKPYYVPKIGRGGTPPCSPFLTPLITLIALHRLLYLSWTLREMF